MKTKNSLIKALLSLSVLFLIAFWGGCKESSTDPGATEPTTNNEAYLKLASQDQSISSFEPSYNEQDAISFIGKINTQIYPFRVGQRVHKVNETLTTQTIGDTTYGTLTTTFEGTLLIFASYSPDSTKQDTLIQKPFSSVVTRKIIFEKVANTDHPMNNWKIAAISLPEGGTLQSNINITKLTVTLQSGDQIVITSPNDYFLVRMQGFGPAEHGHGHDGDGGWGNKFKHGFLGDMPFLNTGEKVKLTLELTSAYADTDFVTLTWGAMLGGMHRSKKKFELVSSTVSGSGYAKVYEQTYESNNYPGFFHAIINAFPKQVINDDGTAVENEMWGVPYVVK